MSSEPPVRRHPPGRTVLLPPPPPPPPPPPVSSVVSGRGGVWGVPLGGGVLCAPVRVTLVYETVRVRSLRPSIFDWHVSWVLCMIAFMLPNVRIFAKIQTLDMVFQRMHHTGINYKDMFKTNKSTAWNVKNSAYTAGKKRCKKASQITAHLTSYIAWQSDARKEDSHTLLIPNYMHWCDKELLRCAFHKFNFFFFWGVWWTPPCWVNTNTMPLPSHSSQEATDGRVLVRRGRGAAPHPTNPFTATEIMLQWTYSSTRAKGHGTVM